MIDHLLRSRIDDAVRLSSKRPSYVGFLNPAEKASVEEYLKWNNQAEFMYYGGFEDAERCFFCAYQDYFQVEYSDFPITPVTFKFKSQYELTHRDFLGSFMAQGITRNSIGDILIESGRAVVFIKSDLAGYISDSISKIGRVGVRSEIGCAGELPQMNNYEELSGVIASVRLDCIVAQLAGLSRDKAASLIRSGSVQVNYKECSVVSESIVEKSTISIRSKGKFVVDDLSAMTKKGRIVIKYRKYK